MKLNHGDSSNPPKAREGSLDAVSALSEADVSGERAAAQDAINRRTSERVGVTWVVDCETEETFLYASIRNISEMGIFVQTTKPLTVGTRLTLRFAPQGVPVSYVLEGTVQWINVAHPLRETLNPGMGIRFVDLTPEDRERIVETIRTIAYLRDAPVPSN
jgi:type IV pilus assembly protein PilZ